ncbi:glycosyltransferase family 4 protein [Bacillus weihaiensis]|uniref:glycosyltransferase family 4 protein n=1 Tax=Bacillus weihaiensis TaxID=1547283 RepID=UPI002351F888|nr:glycosyltransferase family 4 protein [Bacillus weihaiensis]
MKSKLIKALFLLSLNIESTPIQNRLFRLLVEKNSDAFLEPLLTSAIKRKKQTEFLHVINQSNIISDIDKKKLAAKVWFSLGLPKKSWLELRSLSTEDELINKQKASLLYELRDVESFIKTFEDENTYHQYLSKSEEETFINYSILRSNPSSVQNILRILGRTSSYSILDKNTEYDSAALIEDRTELIESSIKNNSPATPALIVKTLKDLEWSAPKYEHLLLKVFDLNERYEIRLPLQHSSWQDLVQIHKLLNSESYEKALCIANNAYEKGERSELLKKYYYVCLGTVSSSSDGRVRRVIDEEFISLFSDEMIFVLEKNELSTFLFDYLPIENYRLENFKEDLKKLAHLSHSMREKLSQKIVHKLNNGSFIYLLDDEVLQLLTDWMKSNSELEVLKTKYFIGTSQNEKAKKMIQYYVTNKKVNALLELSTYAFDLKMFQMALYITEQVYELSAWNIRALRRLVTIHHRIGNITEKLKYLEKLNRLTFNLLKGDLAIARDEANLLHNKWEWEATLNNPPLGNQVIHVLNKSIPEVNGYTIRSKEIVQHQLKLGFEPVVVTKLGWPHSRGRKEKIEVIDGIPYQRIYDISNDLRLNVVPMSRYFNAYANRFAKFLIENSPKLVHAASNFQNALPAIMAAKKLGIPTIYEVRGLWQDSTASKIPEFDQSERYRLHQKYELYCCEIADKVVVIGESLASHLIGLGVDPSKISIVPNGVDVDEFKPLSPNEALIDRYNLKGKIVFGFIGSVTEYEGLELLLKSLNKLRQVNEDIAFMLVGDGPALKGLKELANQLGLNDIVHFIGRVPHADVKKYYSVIDAFPFPRTNAKVCALVTPLKPFEVMGMGKLTLVSNIPALKEMVKDKQTGLIFEAENVESLYQTLIRVNEYKHLGMQGRAWVEKERAWNLLIKRYIDVYESLET